MKCYKIWQLTAINSRSDSAVCSICSLIYPDDGECCDDWFDVKCMSVKYPSSHTLHVGINTCHLLTLQCCNALAVTM